MVARPSKAEAAVKPRRLRRLLFGRLLPTFLLILVLVYLFRTALIAPFIRSLAISSAQQELGLTLSIGDLGGNWFTELDVQDVETREAGTSTALSGLSFKRLRVAYNPWQLLTDPMNAVETVHIEEAHLALDLTQVSESDEPKDTAPLELPSHLPRVKIETLSLDIKGEDFDLQAPDTHVQVTPNDDGSHELHLRSSVKTLEVGDWSPGSLPLDVRARYDGSSLDIEPCALGDFVDVERLNVDLSRLEANALALKGAFGVANGKVSVETAKTDERLEGDIQVRDVDLEALADLVPGMADTPVVGEATLSGKFNAKIDDFLSGELETDLIVHRAQWKELAVDRLEVRARSDSGALHCSLLEIDDGADHVRIEDAIIPHEAFADPERLFDITSKSIRANLDSLVASLEAAGVDLSLGDRPIPPHHIRLQASLERGEITVAEGQFVTEGASISFDGARCSLAKDLGLDGSEINTALGVEISDLAPIIRLFSPIEARGSLSGIVQLSGTWPDAIFNTSLEGKNLFYEEHEIGSLTLVADGTAEHVELRQLTLDGSDYHVDVRGEVLPLELQTKGLHIEGRGRDLPPILRDLALPLSLGSWNLVADATGSLKNPLGSVSLDLDAGTYEELALRDIHLVGRRRSHESIDVDTLSLSYGRYDVELEAGLSHDPNFQNLSLNLRRLSRSGGENRLTLKEPSQLSWDGSELGVSSLHLQGASGELSVRGRYRTDGWMDAHLTAKAFDPSSLLLHRWIPDLSIRRIEHLESHVQGTWPDAKGTLDMSLVGLKYRDFPETKLRLDGTLQNDTLSLRKLALEDDSRNRVLIYGQAPLTFEEPNSLQSMLPHGPLDLTVLTRIPQPAPWLESLPEPPFDFTVAHSDLVLTGSWDDPNVSLYARVEGATRADIEESFVATGLDSVLSAHYKNGRAVVDSLLIATPQGRIEGSAVARTSLAPSSLLSPQWSLSNIPLRGSLDLDIKDLAQFGPTSWARRMEGAVNGNLRIDGTIGAPLLDGEVYLDHCRLLPTSVAMPALDAICGNLRFNATECRIHQLRGELGGSPFQARGVLDFGTGESPSLELSLSGDDLLLFRQDGVKVRADTDLTVEGPLESLHVAGEVALTDSRFVKAFDLLALARPGRSRITGPEGLYLFSLPQEPLNAMTFDVAVTSPTGFRLDNNVVKGTLRPKLRLQGNGAVPVLWGNLFLDARVSLPATSLQVQEGLISIYESDPFHPELEMVATTRMMGYEVTIHVNGPYTEPRLEFSSIPPLPDDEILLMVLAGTPPESGFGSNAQREAVGTVAYYLGKDLVLQLFTDGSTESAESFLERLELETIPGHSRSGLDIIEARFRFADDILVDNDALYLEGERDEYDDFNIGLKLVFKLR